MTSVALYFNICNLRAKRLERTKLFSVKLWRVTFHPLHRPTFRDWLSRHTPTFSVVWLLSYNWDWSLDSAVIRDNSCLLPASLLKGRKEFEWWQDFKWKNNLRKQYSEGLLWFSLVILCDLVGITLFHLWSISWLAEMV